MTTSEIPHHRHRYPQGDLPPLATPGKTTPQTARTFLTSVPALGALSAGRFRRGRRYDFGDQAQIDEMLHVLARRERDFAPAPIGGIHQATASYRQRLFVEHDLGGSLGSAVDAAPSWVSID